MLRALFWKDVRINRLPLLVGVILLIGPYLLAVGVGTFNSPAGTSAMWGGILALGSIYGLACSQLTLAVLAGNVIAVERADRSAEFLGYLPASKAQILLSKSALLIGAGLIVTAVNLAALMIANSMIGSATGGSAGMSLLDLSQISLVGVGAAGVGWAASAKLETTGAPVLFAIATPIMVPGAFYLTYFALGWPLEELSGTTILLTCGLVGAVFFVIGWVYYLRRVEA
ncbi:MAG: ABC transporter permease [Planctomycetales bacterium]